MKCHALWFLCLILSGVCYVLPRAMYRLSDRASHPPPVRIFSPHEAQTRTDSQDKHPNRKARGQLRTKIESGEGTIPVKSATASKPGTAFCRWAQPQTGSVIFSLTPESRSPDT